MISPLNFLIRLTNIHCYDEGDSIGNAEPYLWAVFFKIDGDTAFVDETLKLQGTAKTFGTLGDHGNLENTDVVEGDDVPIPAQFGYGDVLRPIPLRLPIGDTTQVSGVVGCIAILLEEDNTPAAAVARGHGALGPAVKEALDKLIPTLTMSHDKPSEDEIEDMTDKIGDVIESVIGDATGWPAEIAGGFNDDDKIGSAVFRFSSSDLLDAGPSGIVPRKRWENEGDWELTGKVIVNWSAEEDLGGPPAPPVAQPVDAAAPVSADTAGGSAVTAGALSKQPLVNPLGPIVLNSQMNSAPAVASWQENRLDVFARGVNNHMWQRSWNGAAWSDWIDLNGPPVPPVNTSRALRRAALRSGLHGTAGPFGSNGQIASAPAAVSWGPNRIDAFVRGLDRAMWHRWWDGSTWSNWENLGGTLNSSPAVASWLENRLDCFAQGPSDHLWHKWWDGSVWSDWEDLGGILTSAPAAVSWGPERIDTFVRGTDKHLWHKWYDSGWSDWEDLGGILSAAPAAASRGEGKLDIFVRATDNHLYYKGFKEQKIPVVKVAVWSDWTDLGSTIVDAPAAVSWGSNRLDTFVRSPNHRLVHRSWG